MTPEIYLDPICSITQNVVGDYYSVMLSVPDKNSLLRQINANNIFFCLDSIFWTLYLISFILSCIAIYLSYREHCFQALSLIFITLCRLIQYIPAQLKLKRIKFMFFSFLLMIFVITNLMKNSIKTDIVVIDTRQFLDSAEQLEHRTSIQMHTWKYSSFYTFMVSESNTYYPSIKTRLLNPKNLKQHLKAYFHRISSYIQNYQSIFKSCIILTNLSLTSKFEYICSYNLTNLFYRAKVRLFPLLYFIPYNSKLSSHKKLKIEHM